jgi:hypothetical protein
MEALKTDFEATLREKFTTIRQDLANSSVSKKMMDEAERLMKKDQYINMSSDGNRRARRDVVFEKTWKNAFTTGNSQISPRKNEKKANLKLEQWRALSKQTRSLVPDLPPMSEKDEERMVDELEDLADQSKDKQVSHFVKKLQKVSDTELDLQQFLQKEAAQLFEGQQLVDLTQLVRVDYEYEIDPKLSAESLINDMHAKLSAVKQVKVP